MRNCTLVCLITMGGFAGRSAWAHGNDNDKATAAAETSGPREAVPAEMPVAQAELPDAPLFEPVNHVAEEQSPSLSPGFDLVNGALDASPFGVTPTTSESVPLSGCPYDTTRARECRVHWPQLLISSAVFLTFQSAGNLYTGYWYRYETGHGKWFDRWINSGGDWRWDVWDDDNPPLDQYVGHPMMGSITNYLWIQNDPKGMTLDISNTWPYWRSRLRATAFTTAYSFAWKLGPFGEAGIGHNGDHLVPQGPGKPWSNETGWVELVTTPVGGLLWTMAEDSLDRYVVKKIEEKQRRPATLLLLSFLTPSRATANIFRFRPPWYRDGRQVKADSFWSDPPGPEEAQRPAEASSGDTPHPRDAMMLNSASGSIRSAATPQVLPVWPRPGGVHEFGAWWGFSLISGHIWGYADDVKYMPVDVTYSYLFNPGGKWNFRYSPEVTALAMLDWPTPHKNETRFNMRKRTYGSGVSPVGFRASFNPQGRVQPFFSTNGGFIYFMDRVLSPQGSQFMYIIDFGGGVQIFRKQRQTVTLGYRYQHLSNANISLHNPGTDANTFYVAVSRFRTKGYR
jgi:Lipid A 3-O-deacylase (PagL)